MKEINIARVLARKRKEKGITQDELANYIGVSKASVSKWETGQSYPDITFLPQLAAYFNISVDDLIDYQPQMTREDIHKLYRRLSADFAAKPFEAVLTECRETIKKYYACFPLLLQMGLLMVNHVELVKGTPQAAALLEEARALFVRVKEESDEVPVTRKALYMEAYCSLITGDAKGALVLLEDSVEPALPPEILMASAYQMTGRPKDAQEVLQVGIYQNIVVLFNFFPAYLNLCADDPDRFDEVLRRALALAELFDMKHLHPGVLVGLYICAANGYAARNDHDQALAMLEQYTEIVTSDIYPMRLHGDDFFNLLDNWIARLDLGDDLPRDDRTIRTSMYESIALNPAFAVLADDPRFHRIIARLQTNCSQD